MSGGALGARLADADDVGPRSPARRAAGELAGLPDGSNVIYRQQSAIYGCDDFKHVYTYMCLCIYIYIYIHIYIYIYIN